MRTFEAKVTTKGQITLPTKLREGMRLQLGDKVLFIESADGTVHMEAENASLLHLRGIVKGKTVSVTGTQIAKWIKASREARIDPKRR